MLCNSHNPKEMDKEVVQQYLLKRLTDWLKRGLESDWHKLRK